jgi:hypothetical protein
MRTHNRLTAAQLLHLPDGLHADGQGLHLKVAGNARSWVFRFRYHGQRRHMGLGPMPPVSLAEARQLATAARQQLLAGVDPIAARQAHAPRAASSKLRR